ncbi:MAG: glycine cleavage system protein GcvH [Desulfopila sp.]
MKELNELKLPEDLVYTRDHEWVKAESESVVIGISDYAQDQLGDIVFVEMPEEGDSFSAGDEFGTLESVKAVSELYMPIGGEIVGINEELEDSPESINHDPYGAWIIKVKPDDPEEINSLLDRDSYYKILEGE